MRRTKIIATLGPATDSPEMIGKLIDAGLNVARLNMAHADHNWVRRVVRDIRAAASAARSSSASRWIRKVRPSAPAICRRAHLKPGEKFTFTVRGSQRGAAFRGRELRKPHQRHQRGATWVLVDGQI
jgi:pyruvate kinase